GFAVLRSVVPALVAAGMLATTATVLTIVAWAWRRGEPMGAWVLAAHAPLIGVTALLVLRMFGIEPIAFDASTLLSLAIGVILVLLLVALSRRSREVLSVQVRDKDMAAIDPLTGLLSAPLFRGRVRAAVGRYASSRHDAAVIYVRLANYPRIRELHGNDVAEQSMIRAAMKLQRMMHGADCFGRVSESTLGLIFETVTGRGALMERASRLVAHGLMPLPGIQPDVVLQLHVVANVLSDNPLEADHVHSVLENALASMSPRTRRPIRFLVPGATSPQTDLGAPGPADGGTQQHHARAAA
ncbi:MAG TPA: diguanylate cyclase, partial [Ramlibacter sp.]|nr:diguanylate cyclase [Ramlibacter sp.]